MPETLTRDLRFDRWLLDVNRRELVDEEGWDELSTAEFDLLKVFLERPQRVLSRDQLLDLARGREAVAFDRAIDTLVSRCGASWRGIPRILSSSRPSGVAVTCSPPT